ncbi:hypothetical protein U9M48_004174 [Paspalum notatum var. saurae]|uniref:Reverse transcriptase domain-containing protein n=1 Tax=Paspalum notatum var. saurae TaxID=547442 RepID=A0AAQ3PN70_PASNO
MADLAVGLAKTVLEGALSRAQSAIDEEETPRLRESTRRDLVFIAGEFEMMLSCLGVADAERVNNGVVRTWLRQVHDLAYDAEDCVDLAVHLDSGTSWWRRTQLPPCVPAAAPRHSDAAAAAEIERLRARVEDVSRRNSRYGLITDSGSEPGVQQQLLAPRAGISAAALGEAKNSAKKQWGFEHLTQLIAKNGSDLGVISVLGKSDHVGAMSIIRKAYEDPEICRTFGCRGWVKLEHPFSPHSFLQSVVSQFYANSCLQRGTSVDVVELERMEGAAMKERGLIEEFWIQVSEQRYLLVVENVCNMGEWDAIRACLPGRDNGGNRIIVSTEQREIAGLCTGHSYQVLELNNYSADYPVCVFFKQSSQGEIDRPTEITEVKRKVYGRVPMTTQDAARTWMEQNTLVGHSLEAMEIKDPVQQCYKLLKENRFLVVINDLQSKEEWNSIKNALVSRHCQSFIIVITTEENIAIYCADNEDIVFNVKGLESEAAFHLFKEKVFLSQEEKQEVVTDFYSNLLGAAEKRDFTFDLSAFHSQQLDLSSLDEPFTLEEVWATIKDMPLDKAPGPDGFTGRLLNSAFITLIPKSAEAASVKDYRSISLVHSFAKLVTKILANRLAPLLPTLVSINQSAFVRGRSIHDNFMLVQQLAKKLHLSKEPHLLLKLDISKAFDTVSWSFLIEIMLHLGFGLRWCNLICLLLSSSTTQILINGQPGTPISHLRGLRQGDPLSPMLFILVMDVLNSLVSKASSEGLLLPLAGQHSTHRISLYADDVALFIRPTVGDLRLIRDLLDCFGQVAGLKTNLLKSSATPIQCADEDIAYSIKSFPCTYLGLPLTVHKPTKADFMKVIDKVADKLPGWKAPLLNKAGRLVVVKTVLTAVTIHLLIAWDLPKWVIKAIDKLRRGFLWSGQKQANGGNCLISWGRVQQPLCYGGLGVLDLERLGWSLRLRWLWMLKTNANRPWAGLPIQVPAKAGALFDMAVVTSVGNGSDTKFWMDRWLQGKTMAEWAPNLFRLVPKRVVKRRTVSQALTNRSWVADIRGALTVQVLVEYLAIWDLVDGLELRADVPDQHHWKLSSSGCYSSKSAYDALFVGTIKFSLLAKRGLPHHPSCPLCDQADESIQHILMQCVVARELWFQVLQKINLHAVSPPEASSRLTSWWSQSSRALPKDARKGFNSLVILVSWELWKHRNACVFEGVRPDVRAVLFAIVSEGQLWCRAGAVGLQELSLPSQVHRKNPSSPLKDSKCEDIEQLIVKCGGLPKVIVSVADFLAPKTVKSMESTRTINQKFMRELESNPEFGCLRRLFDWMHLFFHTCPDFLRPCIFYLSIFPGYQIIRRRRLLMRWVAEGYSRDTKYNTAEERAEMLFSMLVNLSMIQPPPCTVITHKRMVQCQVNAFFHEYIISRAEEDNIVFALEVFELQGQCRLSSQRTGRHLVIKSSWDRDRIVFDSIDFSRLRSLTVFGKWESFFVSDSMKVLRVLDLEDASGVSDKDLEKIVKLFPRLKFLSLRGKGEICHLPSLLGELRQLETLDVRATSIVTLPASITKLKKLQYIRAGTTSLAEEPSTLSASASWLPNLRRSRPQVGVEVPTGIDKLTALHTLGIINAGITWGKATMKEIKSLTQLRKLGVSGINRKNIKDVSAAISCHVHLESLSLWLSKGNQCCLEDMSPPKKLQTLKMFGIVKVVPQWIKDLPKLTKLELGMAISEEFDIIGVLGLIKELSFLRLCVKPLHGDCGRLDFCVWVNGQQQRCYLKVKILEVACTSKLTVAFGSEAMQNLELLTVCCSSASALQVFELKCLSNLKEVRLLGSHDGILKEDLERQLKEHRGRPTLKLEQSCS